MTKITPLIFANLVTPKARADHEILFNKPTSGDRDNGWTRTRGLRVMSQVFYHCVTNASPTNFTIGSLLLFLHYILTIDIERNNRLLKVCYVPATSTTFLAFFLSFLAVAINSTNEANKAGGTRCLAVYIT